MRQLYAILISVFALTFAQAQSGSIDLNESQLNTHVEISSKELSENPFFKDAKRAREFKLNPSISRHSNLTVGTKIRMQLFSDKDYNAVISNKHTDVNGVTSLTLKLEQYPFASSYITVSGQSFLVFLNIPELNEQYTSRYNSQSGMAHLFLMDETRTEAFKCGAEELSMDDSRGIENPNTNTFNRIDPGETCLDVSSSSDPATISLLMVYTPAAEAWADANQGGINNAISAAISIANDVSANNNLGITFQLAHSQLVNYTEVGAGADLEALRNSTDGEMDEVHQLRKIHNADLVSVFTNFSGDGIGGIAHLNTTRYGHPGKAFSNIKVISQANSPITFIHELGHNMGVDHYRYQSQAPGPTQWLDWPENDWSSGWRDQDGNDFRTVMTYADGIPGPSIPYFSDPTVTFAGDPIGDAVQADNARTLREMKHEVARYSNAAQYCLAGVDIQQAFWINNVSMGDINHSSSSSFYSDLSGLGTCMQPGETQTLVADLENAGGSTYISVWIDWNDDKIFDSSELEYNSTAGLSQYSVDITAPLGFDSGEKRMRIRAYDTGSGGSSDPCGYMTFGEVEDYTILLGEGDFCSTSSIPQNLVVIENNGNSVLISWNPLSGVDYYELQYRQQGETNWITISNILYPFQQISGLTLLTDYEVQIRSVCLGTPTAYSDILPFSTGDYNYCDAGATDPRYEKISNVTFNTINNNSTDTSGYEDFTEISTSVTPGETYPMSISISNFDSNDELYVWIDYNQDGDFTDLGENVISLDPASQTNNENITIPAEALSGNTVMRIRLIFPSSPVNRTPCGDSTWGQVEDYTINILGDCTDPTTWYADTDDDGLGDPNTTTEDCNQPTGYVSNSDDCNDNDANIGGPTTWYADADTDGYGDPNDAIEACEQPEGYVDNSDDQEINSPCPDNVDTNGVSLDSDGDGVLDCNDICQGNDLVDTDLDGTPDDCDACPLDSNNDSDGDGVCDSEDVCPDFNDLADADGDNVPDGCDVCPNHDDAIDSDGDGIPDGCDNCEDADEDGICADTDCNDNDANIGVPTTWYADADNDGYGDPSDTTEACQQPDGYVANNADICIGFDDNLDADGDGVPDGCDDCEDADEDGICADTDCNDNDANIGAPTTWYADADNDGYGDPSDTIEACEQPDGYVANNADICIGFDDNLDADGDGIPDGCDDCEDADDDGICADTDCNDNDANIGAPTTWYADADNDGYGDPSDTTEACQQPDGYVANNADICIGFDDNLDADGDGIPDGCDNCEDADEDGICADIDCNDNDANIGARTIWYADVDGDGYGDLNNTTEACEQPEGYVDNSDDQEINSPCPDNVDTNGVSLDSDGDGVLDCNDICQGNDLVDTDLDGTPDDCDACPLDSNNDSDGDGVCDSEDVCPDFNDLADADGDNVPDGCDVCPGHDDAIDSDGDGVPDGCDNCEDADEDGICVDTDCNDNDANIGAPTTWYADADNDGYGDPNDTTEACQQPDGYVANNADICIGFDDNLDADGDGTPDGCDACPLDSNNDSDGDGVCDSDDICPGFNDLADADGDNVPDGCDVCPNHDDAIDSDGDGVPDGCDNCEDADEDGICADTDCNDNDANIGAPTTWYADADNDGYGDPNNTTEACQQPDGYVANNADICIGFDDNLDADGDGTPDGCDACPLDSNNDSDGDGVCGDLDCDDNDSQAFPGNPEICDGIDNDCDGIIDEGCETCPDADEDTVCDADDICPGYDDLADADKDGIPDDCDACPNDPNNDSDGDGVCGDVDNCPDTANADQADADSDGIGDACDDVDLECDAAYALGDNNICFMDDGFGNWGWTNQLNGAGTYNMNLYAGAGQCNIDNGAFVGTLLIDYANDELDVTYSINSGYVLKGIHFYVGCTPYPKKGRRNTVAPGHYTIGRNNLDNLNSFKIEGLDVSSLSGGDVYVIAHAKVCKMACTDCNNHEVYRPNVKVKCTNQGDRADKASQVVVYPNPVTDELFIKTLDDILMVELFDIEGRRLFYDKQAQKIKVDRFEEGLYLLRITTSQGQHTRRVVIKK
ncbi:GEVED domain-containing protein [Mangrovimonas yunxiaonensis]|uniref:GEVED domain-containing protein n=1 Tax=Mangrovimonas yunxiaonensis TaxID=1197477 RepID=UPI0016654A53|nr:GEVED domain-containing protein [Mangrovimonas yunxiaonensis]GGH43288.1 hypothetical protein GCM10011364_15380 [Mangrovimonas yunxiaonensis]